MKKLIEIKSESASLEITNACLTNCEYCYCREDGPRLKRISHLPKKVIYQRIKWLQKFTNVKRINLIGGEPLLHPDFIEICDYILKKNLKIGIVTSAKVDSKSQKNIEKTIKLFLEKKANIDLSFHPDKNEDSYFSFLFQLCDRIREQSYAEFQKNPKKELHTNITFDTTSISFEKFFQIMKRFYSLFFEEEIEKEKIHLDDAQYSMEEYLKKHYNFLLQHLETIFLRNIYFQSNKNVPVSLDIKIWGATQINPKEIAGIKINEIQNGKGFMCGALNSQYQNGKIILEFLAIKTDGELTFPTPTCLNVKELLGNINKLQTKEDIIPRFKKMRSFIVPLGLQAKRLESDEDKTTCCNGDTRKTTLQKSPDFQECQAYCNLNDMCRICTNIRYL
jgi:organic radical activating enzyme